MGDRGHVRHCGSFKVGHRFAISRMPFVWVWSVSHFFVNPTWKQRVWITRFENIQCRRCGEMMRLDCGLPVSTAESRDESSERVDRDDDGMKQRNVYSSHPTPEFMDQQRLHAHKLE